LRASCGQHRWAGANNRAKKQAGSAGKNKPNRRTAFINKGLPECEYTNTADRNHAGWSRSAQMCRQCAPRSAEPVSHRMMLRATGGIPGSS